jgi:hypothetical protein
LDIENFSLFLHYYGPSYWMLVGAINWWLFNIAKGKGSPNRLESPEKGG